MKNILFLVIMISCVASQAQVITLGVNAGILYNTPPEGTSGTSVKPYGSFRIMKKFSSAVIGVGDDVGSLDAIASAQYIDSASGKVEFMSYTYEFANPFVMPNIFVDFRMPLPKSYWYIGGNLGYMIGQSSYYINPTVNTIGKKEESSSGASIGLHAGFTLQATNKLDVNIEAAARYVSIGTARASIFYFPISAGLRYNF
jgi:hypothetical protein